MSIKTQTYLELLKVCLQDEPKVTERLINLSNGHIDWIDLLNFAARQGVIGVYWRGIELLFQSAIPINKPTDDEVMEWWGEVNDIRKCNEDLFKKTAFVSDTFRKEGFENCILKGQGNALMYPDPYLRIPGDIDIWLKGERKVITTYIQKMFPDEEEGNLHIVFPVFKNTLVEVHYTPSTLSNPFANQYIQKYFKDKQETQIRHTSSLPNGITFTTPTLDFNIIFQLVHIMRHYLYEGISLKQLIDYFYVLKFYHQLKSVHDSPSHNYDIQLILKKTGLLKFARTIMFIMREGLGIKPEYLYINEDEKGGKLILDSILNEKEEHGFALHNMHDLTQYKNTQERQKLKLYRTFKLFPYFPGETFWGLWGRLNNAI